jgi:hypothetical protein
VNIGNSWYLDFVIEPIKFLLDYQIIERITLVMDSDDHIEVDGRGFGDENVSIDTLIISSVGKFTFGLEEIWVRQYAMILVIFSSEATVVVLFRGISLKLL